MALATKTKNPAHYKKVNGDHQRRSKRFTKTYWPYLPLLSVIGIGLISLGAIIIGPVGAVFGTITAGIVAVAILL